MPVPSLEFCFNLQKANVKKYHGLLRLVLTSLLFFKPQHLRPALPQLSCPRARGDTHCNGGRVSGSAGCTGVPILLSPSRGAPAPCMGKRGQPRMVSARPATLNPGPAPGQEQTISPGKQDTPPRGGATGQRWDHSPSQPCCERLAKQAKGGLAGWVISCPTRAQAVSRGADTQLGA